MMSCSSFIFIDIRHNSDLTLWSNKVQLTMIYHHPNSSGFNKSSTTTFHHDTVYHFLSGLRQPPTPWLWLPFSTMTTTSDHNFVYKQTYLLIINIPRWDIPLFRSSSMQVYPFYEILSIIIVLYFIAMQHGIYLKISIFYDL